ncbi:nucleoside phosphorylase [Oceanotoga sp. DSM 15011]|uniref:nucleoside phosphorylase n=1 Tax=Oceanotoga sp. DSM 15011 TaxID=2984951 RepID=UPI0021F46C1A|nr:nucleoside phosphorylase [Oceanotoga sp. DSM 15011]UYP01226.1 nucleoside phosphorylase [Oceanotoga sp. DSM 15011]
MNKDILLPGIKLKKGEVTSKVIVCGDPERAEKISDMLDNKKILNKSREYWSFYGEYKGVPLTITSHGVGASGAMLAFISLIKGGAKHIIRVGTCGGLKKEVKAGTIVVATAASKEEGVSNIYVPESFPAVADFDVLNALMKSAEDKNVEVFKGIIVTQGAYYSGVMPTNTELQAKAGAIALEMEVAALYTAASMFDVKAGSILSVDGNALDVLDAADECEQDPGLLTKTVDKTIEIALDAIINI